MGSLLSDDVFFQEFEYTFGKVIKDMSNGILAKSSTWVYRVAVNVSITLLRKERGVANLKIIDEAIGESEIADVVDVDKEQKEAVLCC